MPSHGDMTPERWKQIEELYHAADTRPPSERAAFLAEACPGDEELRREVESLLNECPTTATARSAAARSMGADRIGTNAGARWRRDSRTIPGASAARRGRHGRGVPRAGRRSSGRDVAIKILPAAFTNDADRVARFEREARVLASLNHPNIGAIYGVEDADGVAPARPRARRRRDARGQTGREA